MHTLPPELTLAVLDGLHAHIALLDDDGRIIAVNRAWRSFAAANGGNDKGCFVGANYIAVCESAVLDKADAIAATVLDGIRSVSSGDRDVFTLEYPCNSPTVERWFILRISRCTAGGKQYLIVAHHDITDRMRAEQALRETKRAVDAANESLRRALEREQQMARTDELTGACNRRHFFEVGNQLFGLSRRHGQSLSVILLDIDRFKRINDRLGHEAGDAALVHVVRVMREHLRGTDLLARIGGEEFAILLPHTDTHHALHVAELLRAGIAAQTIELCGRHQQVTVSAGVATLTDEDTHLESVIRRADSGLYAAKHGGRNRVCLPEVA